MRLLALCLCFFSINVWAQNFTRVMQFGNNPGDLEMYYYVPKQLARTPAVLVALHGCMQGAPDMASPTGLVQLAEKKGFYLLLPQQKASNNGFRCFNWFQTGDNSRDLGEAGSIKSMIEHITKEFSVDAERLFLVGFSAGAAMTSSLVAHYPEVFKGIAIVAGVPHGCANNAGSAFGCMGGTTAANLTPEERARLVQQAAGNFTGPWPKVLVIHGMSDEVVNFKNAGFIIDQWTAVHKISNKPTESRDLGTHKLTEFKNARGQVVVKAITIPGMKHGVPVDPKNGCGKAQSYVLDAKICGVELIADFFGL